MKLPSTDLALLKERPHRTELYLSIYKPTTIMSCIINDAGIVRGEREIFYTGVVGSDADVLDDMTLLVGSSSGASDVGKIRIREISTGTSSFIVAENSDIDWKNGQFLTVLNYVDIWTIYPRIIQDPADDENVIFYKDYDIAYTNQNNILGSFICAGPHRAAFLEVGTGSNLYYTADGTTNLNNETGTYSWEFEGGIPNTSTLKTPGYVQYITPGHHKTTLTVSHGGAGHSDVTYRFVSIYDRPENGSNTPILKWELTSLDGSRAEGGYTAQIKIWEHIDDIQDNALVVIFADDWYGNTKKSLGGNATNCSSIFFVGYVIKGTIQYNYKESYVEFSIGSPTEIMRQSDGFAISCESKVNPTTWFEIKNMNVPRAMYHYLRWHSTVLKVMDFQYTGDDRLHQYFDTDRESLFDAIDNFLRTGIVGELISDRQGKLWAEIDVSATHDYISTGTVTMNINNSDWIAEPSIEEIQINNLAYLETGGIYYNGPTSGIWSAYMSESPGSAPSYRGKVERTQGLILTSQSQLNELTGDLFAYKNAKYNVSMKMAGNYRNIDIAPKEICNLNILPSDTIRNIQFTNKAFHPVSIGFGWRADRAFLCAENVVFNEVTSGIVGKTVSIPVVPPTDGFQVPSYLFPAFPAFSFPEMRSIAEYLLLSKTSVTVAPITNITWEESISSGNALEWLQVSTPDTVTVLKTGFYTLYVNLALKELPLVLAELNFILTASVVIVGNFFTIPISLVYHDYVPAGFLTASYNTAHKTVPLPLQAGSTIQVKILAANGGAGVTTAQLYLVKTADIV